MYAFWYQQTLRIVDPNILSFTIFSLFFVVSTLAEFFCLFIVFHFLSCVDLLFNALNFPLPFLLFLTDVIDKNYTF